MSWGAIERGLTTVAAPVVSPATASTYALYRSGIGSALPELIIKKKLAPDLKRIANELRAISTVV